MKALLLFFLTAMSFLSAQQASDFFPELGSKWHYRTTPLDSLNVPVDSLSFFSTDSFAVQTTYMGQTANIILSRTSQFDIVPFDTSYVHLEGSEAWSYMNAFSVADTIPAADSLGVLSFLSSFSGWYPVFRFTETVNIPYTLVERDTTFTLDSLVIPVRISVKAKRLTDQTTETLAGTFECKRFLITPLIGVKLGPLVIPLIQMEDTIWIAEDKWIVKNVRPSSKVNLALYGGPSLNFPGSITVLANLPTSVSGKEDTDLNYSLLQNYPNPFNPETSFQFTLPKTADIKIVVYNSSGEEVQVLFQGEKPAGVHHISFNAGTLSSGVYYYSIISPSFSETRKMVLLK